MINICINVKGSFFLFLILISLKYNWLFKAKVIFYFGINNIYKCNIYSNNNKGGVNRIRVLQGSYILCAVV